MVKGVTQSGFEFELNADALNTWEAVDMLSRIEDGEMLVFPRFVRLALGNEQAKALAEHLKKCGKPTLEDMQHEIEDMFNTAGVKN